MPAGTQTSTTATTATTRRIEKLKQKKDQLNKKLFDVQKQLKKLKATTEEQHVEDPDEEFVYDEGMRAYVKYPKGTHLFTLIYWHFLAGHPSAYFNVKGFFNVEGLKVILPLAPVYNSLYYGQDKAYGLLKKIRIWADYYLTNSPWLIYDEDDSYGANADELELDTDEETQFEKKKAEHKKKKKRNAGGVQDEFTIADFHKLCLKNEDADEEAEDDEGEDAEEEEEEEEEEDYQKVLAEIPDNAHPELEIPKQKQVQKRIDESVALIKSEVAVLNGDSKKLFLGGWSQGAVVALHAALDKDCPSLGGVLGITPTLHPSQVEKAVNDENKKDTPFCLYLGNKDTTYPVKLLEPLINKLRDGGYQDKFDVEYHDMEHSLNGVTIDEKEIDSNEVEEMWINAYIEKMYECAK
jgi:predicted esterase